MRFCPGIVFCGERAYNKAEKTEECDMIRAFFLLGDQDLSAALKIRDEVFVNEQGFSAELERDDMDMRAVHAVLEDDDGPCGTARLFFDEGRWHIGRMAVLKEKRGRGYGDLMLRMMVDKALNADVDELYVGAQKRAQGFYDKLGFLVCGEEYLEEGCLHVPMLLTAERAHNVLFGGCGGQCGACAGCGGCGKKSDGDAE